MRYRTKRTRRSRFLVSTQHTYHDTFEEAKEEARSLSSFIAATERAENVTFSLQVETGRYTWETIWQPIKTPQGEPLP